MKDERLVRLSSLKICDIMKNRIVLAANKGCDGIDPDNVVDFDSIDFLAFLHDEANKYNMSVGLENTTDITDDVMHLTDFSANEQCAADKENIDCEAFHKFIDAGKPVFHIESPLMMMPGPNTPMISARIFALARAPGKTRTGSIPSSK
ncbi:hypothetical protein V2A60_003939 [Cordyceps javanica]|uniref:alpha-galactosidase n=1 Tax=Cordyceps javanica TaxID=43265 RepID=A0A545VSG9_9HYPO|nr:endo alpha-1,4 polygalactosaminidase precursor [Cordyceps javanica]TQW04682.1 endo alpha-1,4 polygalactosaminidase precursor [Cordyceps javanica]